MRDNLFSGLRHLTVAAVLCSQVNDHATGLHTFDHLTCNQHRSWFPGNQRRRYDDVDFFCLLSKQFHLGRDELFAHCFGITAFAFARLFEFKFEKVRAHTFDLVFDRQSRIERTNDCPKTFGCSNGSQPCNARPNHKHFRRGDFARRCYLPGKETPEITSGFDDRPIAGDICHGAQRVQFLCS